MRILGCGCLKKVGSKKIPVMNLWGGTKIGGEMLSMFPGMRLKPSTMGVSIPGMHLDVFDDEGNSVRAETVTLLSGLPGLL